VQALETMLAILIGPACITIMMIINIMIIAPMEPVQRAGPILQQPITQLSLTQLLSQYLHRQCSRAKLAQLLPPRRPYRLMLPLPLAPVQLARPILQQLAITTLMEQV
jgi:hypothetical protein